MSRLPARMVACFLLLACRFTRAVWLNIPMAFYWVPGFNSTFLGLGIGTMNDCRLQSALAPHLPCLSLNERARSLIALHRVSQELATFSAECSKPMDGCFYQNGYNDLYGLYCNSHLSIRQLVELSRATDKLKLAEMNRVLAMILCRQKTRCPSSSPSTNW